MPRTVPPMIAAGTMATTPQPTLKIDGALTLRPWVPGDAAVAKQAFETPDIQHFHTRHLVDDAEALAWIEYCANSWLEEKSATWAIVDDTNGEIVGRVTINTNLEFGIGEVAYWMLPAGRGRGIARRACVAATKWAHELGIHRVELEHSVSNEGSRRVAVGAGYIQEGIKRASGRHADGWHDMVLYSKLASDP